MKLNLGCGNKKLPGYINIDRNKKVKPDIVCKLGQEILPIGDNLVDYVVGDQFIEHLTSDETVFMIDDLYRVCKPNSIMKFIVPHMLSPVSSKVFHKQTISEFYFEDFDVNADNSTGDKRNYFIVGYKLLFHCYKPEHKNHWLLKYIPFFYIKPCGIIFNLKVIK